MRLHSICQPGLQSSQSSTGARECTSQLTHVNAVRPQFLTAIGLTL